MKIKIYEIKSIKNKVYLDLLEKHKTNSEVQTLLNETIIDQELVLMGDLRLITAINHAVNLKGIKVFLVKDIDSDTFLWAVGKFLINGNIAMYPLLKEQPEELQLAIRSALIKKGLLKKPELKDDM